MTATNEIRALEQLVTESRTQTEAADYLGISQGHLSDMLRGRRAVSKTILEKLGLRRRVVVERVKKVS